MSMRPGIRGPDGSASPVAGRRRPWSATTSRRKLRDRRSPRGADGPFAGAIFHHFPTKLDLFLAVLERDAEREAARWETGSVADVLAGLAAEDPDWATVVIEQSRRRTDPTFRPAGATAPTSSAPP
jgi:hypothetical protein